MKIEKTIHGFQAISYVGLGLLRVSFIGFGYTAIEAMNKCFHKIKDFISPAEYITEEMEGDNIKCEQCNKVDCTCYEEYID